MRFYWIRNYTSQRQFLIYWLLGITNLGNYHTKHHSPAHHQLMQPTYLHTSKQVAQCAIAHILRGCVNFRVLDVYPSTDTETINSNPSQIESQTSILRPTLKLFGSSPSCLSFERHRKCWLTSQPSALRPSQPLMTHVLDVCPPTITETKMLPVFCTAQN